VGAKVDAATPDGFQPLHYAAEQGGAEVCRALLAAGASLGARSAKGATPLHCAAEADELLQPVAPVSGPAGTSDVQHPASCNPLVVQPVRRAACLASLFVMLEDFSGVMCVRKQKVEWFL
jgi:hypothetical protein